MTHIKDLEDGAAESPQATTSNYTSSLGPSSSSSDLHSSSSTYRLNSSAKDFIAGGVAGAMSILTTQPLDTARIRMQQSKGDCSVAQMLIKMIKNEGVASPMKGLALPLSFTALQSAVIFQTYGCAFRWLRPEGTQGEGGPMRGVWESLVAGSFAGSVQVMFWSPIEMIKLQMQMQTLPRGDPAHIRGPWRMASHIIRTRGFSDLYRGFNVTLMRDLPSYGVYFAVYRLLAQSIEPLIDEPSEAGASTQIIAGGLAGVTAWMSIYPLDVIKARMQGSKDHDSSKNWMSYARGIQNESGYRGFIKGLGPTLSRAFVMDSVSFLSLTTVLKILN